MLEELLAAGHSGAEYDAWLINIGEGDQFGSGFVAVNPNSKIPALADHSTPTPTPIFESGAILLYLADKFGAFIRQIRQTGDNLILALLAGRSGSVCWRWIWPFLCLCADQAGVSDQPFYDGDQTAVGSA